MRTTVSISVNPKEAQKTRTLAKKRGFSTVSDYMRFLLSQDDVDLISESEILKRGQEAQKLYRDGKLVRARSMAYLIKRYGN